jgi:glycosyltransferase involved in cell wall biosynthesis
VPEPPTVSVVVNTWRGAPWVAEALGSVVAQTRDDWDCLVFDDGSDDDTAAVARSVDDPRIRVEVSTGRLGLGAARAAAVARTTAPWIAFLDQDDLWLPEKLERQLALAEAPKVSLVYGRAIAFDERGRELAYERHFARRPLPDGDVLPDLARVGNFIPMSSSLVRRSALEAVGGVDARLAVAVDYDLWSRLAGAGAVRAVQDPVMRYRLHDDNMSRRVALASHTEALAVLETMAGRADPATVARRRRVYHSLIGYEELRSGQVGAGLRRIFGRGAPLWLATRPVARTARKLADALAGPPLGVHR